MKKIALLALIALTAMNASAHERTYITDDGTVLYLNELSRIDALKSIFYEVACQDGQHGSYSGVVKIPDTWKENGYNCFVTEIDDSAFCDCVGLTDVTLPGTLITIGDSAFCNCPNMRLSAMPATVSSVGNYAFNGCKALTSVTFSNSLKEIGEYAFNECSNLTSVSWGNSLKEIGEYAFNECSKLSNVSLGNSLEEIGDFAFYGCTNMTSMTIPASVSSIGMGVLGCTDMESITVDPANEVYDSHNDCNAIIIKNEKRLIAGCNNTVIPDDVKVIGRSAFQKFSKMTAIDLKNVEEIGTDAFCNCYSLKEVKMDKVKEVGYEAFSGCGALQKVYMPNVTVLDSYAFQNCQSLTSVDMPLATKIGSRAFSFCNSLYDVYMPKMKEILGGAFFLCTSLVTIDIPASVTRILSEAFMGCDKLEVVFAYWDTPLENVEIGAFPNKEGRILFVPFGTKTAYETARIWKDFSRIVEHQPYSKTIKEDVNEDGQVNSLDALKVYKYMQAH